MTGRPAMTMGAWLRFDAIRSALKVASPRQVLEVGAGRGAMAYNLASRFDYTGVEPDAVSFQSLSRNLGRLGRGRAVLGGADAAPPGPYDLLCAFEVLEHIKQDDLALRQWRGFLTPGGHLLLSVPAGPQMYGPIDRLVGHYRRYERQSLSRLLESCGFEVVRLWTVGAVLGHLIHGVSSFLASRRVVGEGSHEQASAASGRLWQPGNRLSDALRFLTALPFRLVQKPFSRTSFGTDLVVLARRVD